MQRADFSDPAIGDELLHQVPLRVKSIHEALHEKDGGFFNGRDHGVEFGDIERDRFFTENVFASFGAVDAPLGVEMVGQRDVNRVDFGIGEKFFVASVGGGDVACLSKDLRFLKCPTGRGDNIQVMSLKLFDEFTRDIASAKDAPAKSGLRVWVRRHRVRRVCLGPRE